MRLGCWKAMKLASQEAIWLLNYKEKFIMVKDKDAILQELRARTPKSGEYWERSKNLIPGGLMSGARKMEPYPVYVERAKGAYIWDIDGNRYIDCAMSFGVHVLGHGPAPVLKAL